MTIIGAVVLYYIFGFQHMVLNFFMVIVGLSLVSMSLNVVQSKLAQMYMRWLQKLLEEYIQLLRNGGAIKTESEEMISAWKGSPYAKFVLPLLRYTVLLRMYNHTARRWGYTRRQVLRKSMKTKLLKYSTFTRNAELWV